MTIEERVMLLEEISLPKDEIQFLFDVINEIRYFVDLKTLFTIG